MIVKDKVFKDDWKKLMSQGGDGALKEKFISLVPDDVPGVSLFDDAARHFSGEELAEVAAEIILSVFGDCDRDDFHTWDYEHLSFIIEATNRYGFKISENLLNGLPQQFFLRVKRENLVKPQCG